MSADDGRRPTTADGPTTDDATIDNESSPTCSSQIAAELQADYLIQNYAENNKLDKEK
jgi:hypothetical protein